MAEAVLIPTEKREGRGTKKAVRLREKGLLPAVLYGHKEATISLSVPLDKFSAALRHGVRVFDLETGGKVEKAVINELQYDYLGKEILHVDFRRVSTDERITVHVPIELRGTAPGVTGGGVLDQQIHSLEVECLALEIPSSIRVAIGELQIGSAIHVRDLKLPPGVVAQADEDAIVVQVTAPQAEAEEGEAGERAEPELIRPERPAEEDDK
jgi:large subunit ribosomal protein L25